MQIIGILNAPLMENPNVVYFPIPKSDNCLVESLSAHVGLDAHVLASATLMVQSSWLLLVESCGLGSWPVIPLNFAGRY